MNPQWRAAARARTMANGGVAPVGTHGVSTYGNWGCRCPTCTAAWAAHVAASRARRYAITARLGGIAPVSQHNAATRANWGCGCRACLADTAAYGRGRRTREVAR